jgi:methyl-accepting chemotaxis protein
MREFMADWQGAQEMIRTRTAVAEEVLAAAQATAQDGVRQTNDLAAEALGSLARVSGLLLAGVAVALGLGALLALLLTRAITRPIHAVITGLGEGSSQVSAAAGQVSATSQQLAEGSSEQAAAVEQTSASMEEMAAITKQNADNAGQADQLVGDVNQVVARANQAMAELTQAMADISRAGEDTGKIVKTIDEIAFQTNLLALNAAVEAARAGEAGAGFAVVAEEVRNLARRAAEAAKSTSVLITGTIRKTKEGSELVQRTNQAFGEVSARAAKVADLVGEIAAASAEQAQGIDQVNRALNEMDKVTQRNASSAEESASASEELAAQAETMQGCVTQLIHLVGQGRGGNGLDGNGLGGARREEPRALLTAARAALSRRQGGRELDD